MTKQAETVICRFYRLIPEVPVPRPANRPADGMLPTRGVSVLRSPRVCLCIRVVYLSAGDFSLVWNGVKIAGTYAVARLC